MIDTMQRCRTGSEGRISYLKRGYGWDRTRIDGTEGARIWAGHGILAHNLVKRLVQPHLVRRHRA
jgi:hypothetical protein